MEKISIDKFRSLKRSLLDLYQQIEFEWRALLNQEVYDENGFVKIIDYSKDPRDSLEILKSRYKAIIAELVSYDLSDIPFEEWSGISFNSFFPDFSMTGANIDFSLVYCTAGNFKHCNVRNLDCFKATFLDQNSFDSEVVQANPALFVSDDVKDRFYHNNLTLDDIYNYPDIFKNIHFYSSLCSDDKALLKDLSNIFYYDFSGVIIKNIDAIYYLKKENDFSTFNQYANKLSQDTLMEHFLDFSIVFKEYIIGEHKLIKNVDDDGNATYSPPEELSSIIHPVIEHIDSIEDLLCCDDCTLVLDSDQRMIINILGIDNIKRLDKETGFFSSGVFHTFDDFIVSLNSEFFYDIESLSYGLFLHSHSLDYKDFIAAIKNYLERAKSNADSSVIDSMLAKIESSSFHL